MAQADDWNQKIIEEFRANAGKVGGPFEGRPMLLLTHMGAKTGQARTSPLTYLPDGERFVVFASKGGSPTNPDWYYNLRAHPDVTVEVGTERIPVRATEVTGEERDRLYAQQAEANPVFAAYETKTTRKIPVIALERAD